MADGVGGWRDYGVDPSLFSGTLMRTCERLVKEGHFVPSNPVGLLTTSYYELLQNKLHLHGECLTVCAHLLIYPIKINYANRQMLYFVPGLFPSPMRTDVNIDNPMLNYLVKTYCNVCNVM